LNGGKLKNDDQPSNVGVFLIGFGQRPPQKTGKNTTDPPSDAFLIGKMKVE
jgi:hypothetical protein